MRTAGPAPRLVLLSSIAAALPAGCVEDNPYGDPCFLHCWAKPLEVADADADGRFDEVCTDIHSGGAFNPPLPVLDTLGTRACIELQIDHDRVKAVIAAIAEDAVASLPAASIAAWEDLANHLALNAYSECYQYLRGGPAASDIDPVLPGVQACTLASLTPVCQTYARDAMLAHLDLEQGASTPVPSYDGAIYGDVPDGQCAFEPESPTTGGETSVDETGAFGNIDELVSCSPQTKCTVDEALLWNLADGFATFRDEGVTMTLTTVGAPCNVSGARLAGFAHGTDAKALADVLDLRNGDIVTRVEGIPLTSMPNGVRILNDLQSTTDAITFTIQRKVGSTCSVLDYTLTLTGY